MHKIFAFFVFVCFCGLAAAQTYTGVGCTGVTFTAPLVPVPFCVESTRNACRGNGTLSGTVYDLGRACGGASLVGAACYDGPCSVPYNPLNPAQHMPVPPKAFPLLATAITAAIAIAAALLAGVAALVAAPVIVPAGAVALAIAAAVAAIPGFGPASNAQSAANAGGAPLVVNLTPAQLTAGPPLAGDATPASVVVNPNGAFAPGGGGAFAGNGATGGWGAGGATGEWVYTPAATVTNPTPIVTAKISNSGTVFTQSIPSSSSSNGGPASKVRTVTKSSDGSVIVVNSGHVPVTSSAGVDTFLNATVSTTFTPAGPPASTAPVVAIAPTLANGALSGGGSGFTLGSVSGGGLDPGTGTGTGGDSGVTSSGNTCGGPGQPKCQMEGGGSCGGTGQPPCKIDETGTPTGAGAMPSDVISSEFDKLNGALESIKSVEGKDTSWGLVPHWLTNAGGCRPSEVMLFPAKMGVPPLTLDLCPLLPKIYTLMNLLWIATTFGIVIQMVLRVTT